MVPQFFADWNGGQYTFSVSTFRYGYDVITVEVRNAVSIKRTELTGSYIIRSRLDRLSCLTLLGYEDAPTLAAVRIHSGKEILPTVPRSPSLHAEVHNGRRKVSGGGAWDRN
jgi:hypothetical protein